MFHWFAARHYDPPVVLFERFRNSSTFFGTVNLGIRISEHKALLAEFTDLDSVFFHGFQFASSCTARQIKIQILWI